MLILCSIFFKICFFLFTSPIYYQIQNINKCSRSSLMSSKFIVWVVFPHTLLIIRYNMTTNAWSLIWPYHLWKIKLFFMHHTNSRVCTWLFYFHILHFSKMTAIYSSFFSVPSLTRLFWEFSSKTVVKGFILILRFMKIFP